MKPILFCLVCFIVAAFVHTNAQNQMQQDLHKMQHKSYVM